MRQVYHKDSDYNGTQKPDEAVYILLYKLYYIVLYRKNFKMEVGIFGHCNKGSQIKDFMSAEQILQPFIEHKYFTVSYNNTPFVSKITSLISQILLSYIRHRILSLKAAGSASKGNFDFLRPWSYDPRGRDMDGLWAAVNRNEVFF